MVTLTNKSEQSCSLMLLETEQDYSTVVSREPRSDLARPLTICRAIEGMRSLVTRFPDGYEGYVAANKAKGKRDSRKLNAKL